MAKVMVFRGGVNSSIDFYTKDPKLIQTITRTHHIEKVGMMFFLMMFVGVFFGVIFILFAPIVGFIFVGGAGVFTVVALILIIVAARRERKYIKYFKTTEEYRFQLDILEKDIGDEEDETDNKV